MNQTSRPKTARLAAAGLLSLLSLVAVPAPGATEDLAQGTWEGTLRLRGAYLPVRLHVESAEAPLQVTLDVPSLLMAWEPISAARTGEGLEVELPFGLGPIEIDLMAERPSARKALGDDKLEISLERATEQPCVREDIHFQSGETSLAGVRVLPRNKGPHPGAVLLHGSGRQGKKTWVYRSWADLLCRQGMAVLYYDKRGVGESGGDYGAGLRQLANDGRAAVDYLRSLEQVDRARVGLLGWSQGTWLAQQIAADLGDVKFLVLVSAAAGTPREQEFQKIEYGMRADGRTEDEIESALAYAGLYFYVARTGEGWPLLERAIDRARAAEWGQYVDQPTSPSDLEWWHENHSFQPATRAGKLELPILLLYGAADWITPPVENAVKLEGLFERPENVEVMVFPEADHRLEVRPGRDADGNWRWPGLAPGAIAGVRAWLEKEGLVGSG